MITCTEVTGTTCIQGGSVVGRAAFSLPHLVKGNLQFTAGKWYIKHHVRVILFFLSILEIVVKMLESKMLGEVPGGSSSPFMN